MRVANIVSFTVIVIALLPVICHAAQGGFEDYQAPREDINDLEWHMSVKRTQDIVEDIQRRFKLGPNWFSSLQAYEPRLRNHLKTHLNDDSNTIARVYKSSDDKSMIYASQMRNPGADGRLRQNIFSLFKVDEDNFIRPLGYVEVNLEDGMGERFWKEMIRRSQPVKEVFESGNRLLRIVRGYY